MIILPELMIFNPMGIVITYLESLLHWSEMHVKGCRWHQSRHGIAVPMCINYSFRTYRYRMCKLLKTHRVSTPDLKGVFEQGAKALHVGIYARVSTHDQKTLPLQFLAMRDYAEKRG